MRVGTTPLTIHAPLNAPIKSNIISALATLATFFVIAFSKLAHGTCRYVMPINTQKAETVRSDTCEAPRSASLPKVWMVLTSIVTSNAIGSSDNTADGRFLV